MQVEARADHLSADSGALLLREIMERTGIVDWMDERLLDPRNPLLITYPLADLLRDQPVAAGPRLAPGRSHADRGLVIL